MIQLETTDFVRASRSLYYDVAEPSTTTAANLISRLWETGGMAGDDPGGRAWAEVYDRASDATLHAAQDAINACYTLSAMFAQTARNYEAADAASTAGVRHAIAAATATLAGPATIGLAFGVPSAAGGSGGGPPGWGMIKDAVGYVWPNGHQDRLRAAAAAWRSCADSLWSSSEYVGVAAVPAMGDHLPEAADMSTVCDGLYMHIREVAHAQYGLADACDELAHHLDVVHSEVESELVELIAWSSAIQAVGFVGSVFSLGMAEAPTQAVQAARIAKTAARVGQLIEKFTAMARGVAQSIAAVADRAEAVAARLRLVLRVKITAATVTAVGRLRSVKAASEVAALGRLSARAEPRTMLFVDREAARTGLSGDLQRVSNRFFRGATSKSRDFRIVELPEGGYRMEFFSPANNAGYGKLYVETIGTDGNVLTRYKDTLGPNGLIERKWIQGAPR